MRSFIVLCIPSAGIETTMNRGRLTYDAHCNNGSHHKMLLGALSCIGVVRRVRGLRFAYVDLELDE
jgi:hypothetical protein